MIDPLEQFEKAIDRMQQIALERKCCSVRTRALQGVIGRMKTIAKDERRRLSCREKERIEDLRCQIAGFVVRYKELNTELETAKAQATVTALCSGGIHAPQ